jgi:hypothetical protein
MILAVLLLLAGDLDAIKSEPNLERRSERALQNAASAMDLARDAHRAGDSTKAGAALNEVKESVELSYESLVDAGKDPRRHPKYFKAAELKTRDLLRRLTDMSRAVSMEDRELVERVRTSVTEIHDNLINGILSKKKK